MQKSAISNFFLYRHRFVIGFACLGIGYIALLFGLPLLSPGGLSESEMLSAAQSYDLHFSSIFTGDVVNLPYRVLQKLSIMIFGLNIYSVKLPSIIIGVCLGILLILLLNRWFKTNVALLASILAVLSASFLYLAGSGTPLIMLVFWPTLLLWLGSKIQGVTKPKPIYSFIFAFVLLAAIFTPYIPYMAVFIVLFAFLHPHLRFTIKTLPTLPLIITIFIVVVGLFVLVMSAFINPSLIGKLLFTEKLSFGNFFDNLSTAFLPFFTWNTALESPFLSPFVGLASVALAIIGLFSTTKGFFASRNSIAICLIVFTILLAGINPESAILILLPLAILIAHGLRYILDKWYTLFPDNPYARISAVFPIGIFLGIMIFGGITHFLYGYRYVPMVANEFNNDIALIQQHIEPRSTIYVVDNEIEFQFLNILQEQGIYEIANAFPEKEEELPDTFATIEHPPIDNAELYNIITSPKSDNSDRIYMYNTIRKEQPINTEVAPENAEVINEE